MSNTVLRDMPSVFIKKTQMKRGKIIQPIDVPLADNKMGTIVLFGKDKGSVERRIVSLDDAGKSYNVYLGNDDKVISVYIKPSKTRENMRVKDIVDAYNSFTVSHEDIMKAYSDISTDKYKSSRSDSPVEVEEEHWHPFTDEDDCPFY